MAYSPNDDPFREAIAGLREAEKLLKFLKAYPERVAKHNDEVLTLCSVFGTSVCTKQDEDLLRKACKRRNDCIAEREAIREQVDRVTNQSYEGVQRACEKFARHLGNANELFEVFNKGAADYGCSFQSPFLKLTFSRGTRKSLRSQTGFSEDHMPLSQNRVSNSDVTLSEAMQVFETLKSYKDEDVLKFLHYFKSHHAEDSEASRVVTNLLSCESNPSVKHSLDIMSHDQQARIAIDVYVVWVQYAVELFVPSEK